MRGKRLLDMASRFTDLIMVGVLVAGVIYFWTFLRAPVGRDAAWYQTFFAGVLGIASLLLGIRVMIVNQRAAQAAADQAEYARAQTEYARVQTELAKATESYARELARRQLAGDIARLDTLIKRIGEALQKVVDFNRYPFQNSAQWKNVEVDLDPYEMSDLLGPELFARTQSAMEQHSEFVARVVEVQGVAFNVGEARVWAEPKCSECIQVLSPLGPLLQAVRERLTDAYRT